MIFDFDVLNNNRARYVVVAEAFLPILLGLLCCGGIGIEKNMSGERKAFLGVMYIVVALLWGFSLFVSSMNYDEIALIMFASFSALLLCICLYACFYHEHGKLTMLTVFTQFVVVLSLLTAVTSPTTDNYAQMLTALTFAPVGLSAAIGINHWHWLE